jgi:hypothetical protein
MGALHPCIVLCRERGDRLGRQAQARDERPDGGNELPVGRRPLRCGPGPYRNGHHAHGHAGGRPPGRRGAAIVAAFVVVGQRREPGRTPAVFGRGRTLALGQAVRRQGPTSIRPGARQTRRAPARDDDAGALSAAFPTRVLSMADAWADARLAPRPTRTLTPDPVPQSPPPWRPRGWLRPPGVAMAPLVTPGVSGRAAAAWRCDGPPGPGGEGRRAGRPARPPHRPPPAASAAPGRR